jgi:hypothetical protein
MIAKTYAICRWLTHPPDGVYIGLRLPSGDSG